MKVEYVQNLIIAHFLPDSSFFGSYLFHYLAPGVP